MMMMIIIIIIIITISKSLRQYLRNIPGKHEIKQLQKQPYWALHTHTAESADVKVNTYFADEITLHVAQIVSTEQLLHYIPYKHGLFNVCYCKYPA